MGVMEVSGLTKNFDGVQALHDVTLSIEEGEMVGLIGPNGAGKTTFFNCITGFLEPSEGTVVFQGEDITALEAHETARLGMVRTFQHSRPLGSMSVKENVMLPALDHPGEHTVQALLRTEEMRTFEHELEDRAEQLLDRFDLLEKADNYASQLSGGERKLMEIARTMMLDPDLFLLDEPYAGVEESMIARISDTLRDLNDEEMTFIVIEHGLEALVNLVERLVVLHNGELLADGDPQEVVENPDVIEVYLASSIS